MNTEQLSNFQLLLLSKNKANNSIVRKLALAEFERRKLNEDEILSLSHKYKEFRNAEKQMSLPKYAKILLLVFAPLLCGHVLLLILQNIFNAVLLDKGYFKMEKQYWAFITLGYLLWTLLFLIFAKLLIA